MIKTSAGTRLRALSGASAMSLALALSSGVATAQASETVDVDIAAQPLDHALLLYSDQTDTTIVVEAELTQGKVAPSVQGNMSADEALAKLLEGSGLAPTRAANGRVTIAQAEENEDPQGLAVLAQAETGGSSTGRTREKIIVTGQKREEYIQDVPIAISAFSQEDLTMSQIAGGPDLITQIPNFTFTKTNFSGYSIQIRGIGTQAISATTDPAVAVALNNTPFIRNRFFEQEFYDMERVEVLRGPQGTLYGRNATAGVVNLISAKPVLGEDEARASVDLGNFNSRRMEAMVNVPLVGDQVALRLAGAWTDRDGYATNEITDNPIDGRDLWSTRLSLRFAPNDRIDANLIWEHFEEDDDRLRSGKQLCHKDVVEEVGGIPVEYEDTLAKNGQSVLFAGVQALFSQGCARGSLYSSDAFQTPNGLMLPYYKPLGAINLPDALNDPYVSTVQSQDLRVIESTIDPEYRARADLGEFQVKYELTDALTLESETAYSADVVYSLQDFNRFNTQSGAWGQPILNANDPTEFTLIEGPNGGIFCDPQLGCSDRLVAVDISTAESRHFSQEFRLSSQYAGPFNFSLGGNYLRYDTEDKYYVFINSLSLTAALSEEATNVRGPYIGGVTDNVECLDDGFLPGDPNATYSVTGCIYMDPNPIESVNDQGHNYFLSKNPYKLISYAAFGEAYWNLAENLKLTAGLRFTVDKKSAPRVPSWLLAANSVGYPVAETVRQEWREPTGRLAIDWKPDLGLTDETLIYGSYARGYKAGGANPPPFVKVYYADSTVGEILTEVSATRPKTFDAEFVDAFEIGAKNTLLDGDLTLNLAAFYYDYEGYQVSEIVDRQAFNRNFDAEVWGAEIEAEWWALENLRLSFKGGYENTRIADGEQAVDLMDRTAGNEDWMVVRPFPTQASSCILPTYVYLDSSVNYGDTPGLRGVGYPGGGGPGGCELAYLLGLDPQTANDYVPNPTPGDNLSAQPLSPGYPGFDPSTAPNNGEGFFKDLSGSELPNAPHWTATLSGDYILPLGTDWTLTFHTDLYYQAESWWRVFQDHEFSRLNEYYTMNLAAILKSEDGWNIMGYIKNVTDETAITGAFLNSDDTGLTTNVFLTEPRLYGVRVTKDWTGGTFLGSLIDGDRRDPNKPYPFTLTVGGQIQRWDAPDEEFSPAFLDGFGADIDPRGARSDDLDWGDGREIKLTYRPNASWSYSLGARFGETNVKDRLTLEGEVVETCTVLAPCDDVFVQQIERTNYSVSDWSKREEHVIVDFLVGRDFGIGLPSDRVASTLSAGMRYAEFKSTGQSSVIGTPDWYLPPAFFIFLPGRHTEYAGAVEADRQFEGVGPIISWDASSRLVGDSDSGSLALDWSLSGGVLFGKQKSAGEGLLDERYYYQSFIDAFYGYYLPGESPDPFDFSRSDDVSVPMIEAAFGLSYKVQRMSVGVGYRWERYYDAIDGGIAEEDRVDRTIDGPYFNVSIGFGG